jgi:integrase
MPNSLRQKSAEHSAKRRGWKSHLGRVGIIREPAFCLLCRRRHNRHSFAVNALLRWYREGAEVEAKLPLLATYMGHASVVSTHYYLHWIEPLRTAASEKFARHYGELVVPVPNRKGGQR